MKFVRPILSAALLSVAGTQLFAAPLTHWKLGWEYEKKMDFRIVFSRVRADAWDGSDIVYVGASKFTTQRNDEKAAKLTFAQSDLFRLEGSPEFRIEFEERGWLETARDSAESAWKFIGNDALESMDVGKDFKKFIVSQSGANKLLGLDAFSAETAELFKNKAYEMRWASEDDDASVQVFKGSDTDEKAPELVRDFGKSEVKFSYRSLCEGRCGEEYWLVDGDVLSGIVPQGMLHNAGFKGRVWLRWVESTPETQKGDSELANHPAKIVIWPKPHKGEAGKVEFFFETAGGEKQSVKIRNDELKGDFYVDPDLGIVVKGRVEVKGAEYSGDMPKFGDFVGEIKRLSAKLNMEFNYAQRASDTE